MPKDYTVMPPQQLRRIDRSMEDEWIVAMLQRAPVAVMATVYEGQPFINTNLFVYDEAAHVIFMHTARTGRTRNNVTGDERVCLSVFEMGRLLPHELAVEFSVEYAGVNVFGRASIIGGESEEAEHGLQMLLDKYFPHLQPGRDYRPIIPAELKRTAVYKVEIDSWSGKRKQAEPDFPGAFLYGKHGDRL